MSSAWVYFGMLAALADAGTPGVVVVGQPPDAPMTRIALGSPEGGLLRLRWQVLMLAWLLDFFASCCMPW